MTSVELSPAPFPPQTLHTTGTGAAKVGGTNVPCADTGTVDAGTNAPGVWTTVVVVIEVATAGMGAADAVATAGRVTGAATAAAMAAGCSGAGAATSDAPHHLQNRDPGGKGPCPCGHTGATVLVAMRLPLPIAPQSSNDLSDFRSLRVSISSSGSQQQSQLSQTLM